MSIKNSIHETFIRRQPLYAKALCILYVLITLSPLVVILIGPTPPPKNFWVEFSIAIAYIALALIGMQFLLTARLGPFTKPFGIDIILQFHRFISFVIVLFVIAHPLILFLQDPQLLKILNPKSMPARTVYALIATISLLLLIALSVWRKQLRISFELWRVSHSILAICCLTFGLLHVLALNHYLQIYWKKLLWSVVALSVILVLIYVRIIVPILLLRKPWKVIQIKKEADRCWSITLEAINHRGMNFSPGQFVWLTIGYSPYIIKDHPFTISSSAFEKTKITFTIKELGDFTHTLKHLPIGTKAYMEGPHGIFSIDYFPKANTFIFIAGGIGITPMISNLRTMHKRNDQRFVTLVYAANYPEDLAFKDEIDQLTKTLNLKVFYFLRYPPEGWQGKSGLIDSEFIEKDIVDTLHHPVQCFICGSHQMNKQISLILRQHHIHSSNIHTELFNLV